jgi:hypothetical protein
MILPWFLYIETYVIVVLKEVNDCVCSCKFGFYTVQVLDIE